MVSQRLHHRVNTWTRILSCFVTTPSLVFFTIILAGILDHSFPADKQGYSAMIVGALSLLLGWNAIALILLSFDSLGRWLQFCGDTVSFLSLSILGSIGFAHDDLRYFSTGMYKQYADNDWLLFAKIGGSLALTSAVIQFLLIIWSFIKPSAGIVRIVGEPPAYDFNAKKEKEKEIEEWESVDTQFDGNKDRKLGFEV